MLSFKKVTSKTHQKDKNHIVMTSKIFILAILALTLFVSNATSQSTYCSGPEEDYAYYFPYKYNSSDPSLQLTSPKNLTGKVVVITGGVSKDGMLGQAGVLAWLAKNREGAIVFTMSRNEALPEVNWHHFVGDIRSNGAVHSFLKYVKRTLKRQYNMNNPKIDYFGLIAGEMEWAYYQDVDYATQRAMIDNNYGGNYMVWDVARSEDFDLLHNETVTGFTVSTAAVAPTGNTKAYDQSKVLLWNHIWQQEFEDIRNNTGRHNYGLFPDAVSNVSITCDTMIPSVEVEECLYLNKNSRKFCPFPLFPYTTNALDTAEYHLLIWKGFRPNTSYFFINSAFPIDKVGYNWDTWVPLRYTASPRCYATTFLSQFNRIAAQCTEPVGPR